MIVDTSSAFYQPKRQCVELVGTGVIDLAHIVSSVATATLSGSGMDLQQVSMSVRPVMDLKSSRVMD